MAKPKLLMAAALGIGLLIPSAMHGQGARKGSAPAGKAPALTELDYIEIRQLVARYAFAVDSGGNNGYDYADLFTADGEFMRPYSKGREELAKLARGGRLAPSNVVHYIFNHVIEPTADGAIGREYLFELNFNQAGRGQGGPAAGGPGSRGSTRGESAGPERPWSGRGRPWRQPVGHDRPEERRAREDRRALRRRLRKNGGRLALQETRLHSVEERTEPGAAGAAAHSRRRREGHRARPGAAERLHRADETIDADGHGLHPDRAARRQLRPRARFRLREGRERRTLRAACTRRTPSLPAPPATISWSRWRRRNRAGRSMSVTTSRIT